LFIPARVKIRLRLTGAILKGLLSNPAQIKLKVSPSLLPSVV
jgi:hypothetical protein